MSEKTNRHCRKHQEQEPQSGSEVNLWCELDAQLWEEDHGRKLLWLRCGDPHLTVTTNKCLSVNSINNNHKTGALSKFNLKRLQFKFTEKTEIIYFILLALVSFTCFSFLVEY